MYLIIKVVLSVQRLVIKLKYNLTSIISDLESTYLKQLYICNPFI